MSLLKKSTEDISDLDPISKRKARREALLGNIKSRRRRKMDTARK
jgi:hypothetical protein